MRQLFPTQIDPLDPAGAYDDLPGVAHRPAVRLNMIASVDGATAVGDVSGGLGGPADKHVFGVLRSLADVVLVAAGTVRAEQYGPSDMPIAVVTRTAQLDWQSPFFSMARARPIVLTVDDAPAESLRRAAEVALAGLIDELCLTLSPKLAAGSANRIIAAPALPTPTPLELHSILEDDGYLFLRYRTGSVIGNAT